MVQMVRNLNQINLIKEMYQFMYQIYKDMEHHYMIKISNFKNMDTKVI